MASFHQRLGPTKLAFAGILQPLIDAIKLFLKTRFRPHFRRQQFYTISPLLSLLLAAFIFNLMPWTSVAFMSDYSLLLFLCFSSISVILNLLRGWRSNRKYTLIGALRRVAQRISYEAVFRTLILLIITILGTYRIQACRQKSSLLTLYLLPIWFICLLGETHRAPFDFREAESELVSGFNTEYSGQMFAFLFLSEYIMVIFGRLLMAKIFLGAQSTTGLVVYSIGFLFLITWVRITFCRFRYDLLMRFAWKQILPLVLSAFMVVFWL